MPAANPFLGLTLLFFVSLVFLTLYLVKKGQSLSLLQKELKQRDRIIKDLDQQAKLIIKSDMEVKLYQQEIEAELGRLTLIKNLISSSVETLDREKLLSQIDAQLIEALGFKKGLVLDFTTLTSKINIGFIPKETEAIKNILQYKKETFKEMELLPKNSELYQQLKNAAALDEMLAASIKSRESAYAIFLVSDPLVSVEISKSESAAFTTVCTYLGQCLNNIQLFEDLYHTKDALEKKIKERTNELVKSLRAVETISKSKTDFVSSVSHELRTPLTSVKGFSSLLLDEKFGALPQEAKDRLLKIDTNVNKLMDIVNMLLDISRIESGKTEVHITVHEIAKLVTDTTDFLAPQAQVKGIKFAFDLPKKLNVYMDRNLIERVFINLINNSIKFTGTGGQIKISCKPGQNQAIISVADTGCGIEKENLEKVFQEFFTVPNPVNMGAKGTGLGLSLVKKIIETHKEKIWVESEAGKGTTFFFTLKMVKDG